MKKSYWISIVIALALLTLILALSLTLTKRPSESSSANPSKCYAKAAVATDAETCSEIGRDILQSNGSAVDAAIAALLCLSVIIPHSMGIGGGVVFTIYNASTGKLETINARETAPKCASDIMIGKHPNTRKEKPELFIAVPGELRGYEMAHQKYGRLQWRKLFEPSINLAKNGFRIGKALADAINETSDIILNDTALCEVFCDSNKTSILKENDTIKFPKLAETYKMIAENNSSAFYSGPLTQNIVDDIKAKGYNLSSSSVSTPEIKTLTYHRMIETFRLANAVKSELGDPRYENITEIVKNMISVGFADEIRSMIKDDTTKQGRYDVKTLCEGHGTSHLSVLAEDGSAVAVTSSINNYFGSGVMSPSTGIIFNDHMCDFSDPNSVINGVNKNNLIKAGKRPLSSKCPTIILDKQSKQVKMVVGGAGGRNITTATAQVILDYLFFDYNLQKAVEEPRVQVPINVTNVEKEFDERVTRGLKLKNHTIGSNTEVSSVQAVVRQGDQICAESDYRNHGYPAGY